LDRSQWVGGIFDFAAIAETLRDRVLVYDFLLVINCTRGRILHRFRDIAVDKSNIAIFGYPTCV